MVIKIGFEKPYHHLYWNFVDLVFQAKGVGCTWRRWIKGCLQSVNFSVFINWRPNGKLGSSRGSRQGDPLSPFLFTLTADGLSRLMSRAVEGRLVKGISVGKDKVEVWDDTLFFSVGDEQAIANFLRVLNSFSLISGLEVKMANSVIVRINSDEDKVKILANNFGLTMGSWPLN